MAKTNVTITVRGWSGIIPADLARKILGLVTPKPPDDPRAVAILSVKEDAMMSPRVGCGPWTKQP